MKDITVGELIKTLSGLPEDMPVVFFDDEGDEFYSHSSILQVTERSTGKESILLGCPSYAVDDPSIAGVDSGGQPTFTFKKLLD